MSDHGSSDEASKIALSVSPGDDEDVAEGLDTDSFRSYLRTAHEGPVSLADEWEEFVSCGCGSTKDVTLQVVSITGGSSIGDGTDIEFEPAD